MRCTANEETVLVLQIESKQAYDNLDAIATIPGIDVLFVGPADLSASLRRHYANRCARRPIMPATLAADSRAATSSSARHWMMSLRNPEKKISWGYRFLNVGSPLGYGLPVLKQHLATCGRGPAPVIRPQAVSHAVNRKPAWAQVCANRRFLFIHTLVFFQALLIVSGSSGLETAYHSPCLICAGRVKGSLPTTVME